jgi:H+/Cl- antiporter ClcA
MIIYCVCGIIIGGMYGYYNAVNHKCEGYCEACEGDPTKRPITIVYAIGGGIMGAVIGLIKTFKYI